MIREQDKIKAASEEIDLFASRASCGDHAVSCLPFRGLVPHGLSLDGLPLQHARKSGRLDRRLTAFGPPLAASRAGRIAEAPERWSLGLARD